MIDILTGPLSYDEQWGIYAERIGGQFMPESPARFGQRQFENGGLLDDCVYFMNNLRAQDALDRLSGWTDGTESERQHIEEDDSVIRDAAETLIEEVNDTRTPPETEES